MWVPGPRLSNQYGRPRRRWSRGVTPKGGTRASGSDFLESYWNSGHPTFSGEEQAERRESGDLVEITADSARA